jgi:hypothetical protein
LLAPADKVLKDARQLIAKPQPRRYSANAVRSRIAASTPVIPAAAQPDEPPPDQSLDIPIPAASAGIDQRPSRGVVFASLAILASCGILFALLIRNADYWVPVWAPKSASGRGVNAPAAERPAPAGKSDFATSYERLGRALSAFPGASTADVMQAARQAVPEAAKGCAVRWQNGEAALQYGKDGGASALAAAIGHCADAVEGLRSRLAGAQGKSRGETGY